LRQALAKAQFARTLPGSPHGYNQFFTYHTSFEGAGCWQVTLTKESGHWQVSGYRFRRRQKNDKQDMTQLGEAVGRSAISSDYGVIRRVTP
jgi:hypothetical protein